MKKTLGISIVFFAVLIFPRISLSTSSGLMWENQGRVENLYRGVVAKC